MKAVKWGLGAEIVCAWLFTLPVCFALGAAASLMARHWGVLTLLLLTPLLTAGVLWAGR